MFVHHEPYLLWGEFFLALNFLQFTLSIQNNHKLLGNSLPNFYIHFGYNEKLITPKYSLKTEVSI